MKPQDSNTITSVNYFKNNYIKMIIFILISVILTGLLTHRYYNKNELYFSFVKIRYNGSVNWDVTNLKQPHLDLLFFLEKNNINNVLLLQNRHKNNIVQVEIPHNSSDDRNNENFKKLLELMEEYKDVIRDRINTYSDLLEKRYNNLISQTMNDDKISQQKKQELVISYYMHIENYLVKKDHFLKLLNTEGVFKVSYDGKINFKKAKRMLAKNLIISLMLSIIVVIFSLWIKLFIREIKKNS